MSFEYDDVVRSLMFACGELAKRCEAEEQDERADAHAMYEASDSIRLMATSLFCSFDCDPAERTAARLQEIAFERGVPYRAPFGEAATSGAPVTWRALQLAEAEHHQICDPELARLTGDERMRRYAIRLVNVSNATISVIGIFTRGSDRLWRTFADLMMLAMRLSSAAGDDLSEHAIPRTEAELNAALSIEDSGF